MKKKLTAVLCTFPIRPLVVSGKYTGSHYTQIRYKERKKDKQPKYSSECTGAAKWEDVYLREKFPAGDIDLPKPTEIPTECIRQLPYQPRTELQHPDYCSSYFECNKYGKKWNSTEASLPEKQ